ncbi:Uncharacterized protein FKW44_022769 [Caligus rogercresseyi]|uniref:Uncharacterized protein n=1 Tax=Caligus rogercresseyi TaxID=217165 RepID=A0A7T8GNX0_CALRO|nr:Uncharacterized protein FKW44_022769 [Caligus rogercresseyi]
MSSLKLLLLLPTLLSVSSLGHSSPVEDRSFFFEARTVDQKYNLGSKIYLFALTSDGGSWNDNDDWKTCTWTRERDNTNCKIFYRCSGALCDVGVGTFSRYMECDAQLQNKISFFGPGSDDRNNFCGIIIKSLNRYDISTWRVEVEQCKVTGCGSEEGSGLRIKTGIKVEKSDS